MPRGYSSANPASKFAVESLFVDIFPTYCHKFVKPFTSLLISSHADDADSLIILLIKTAVDHYAIMDVERTASESTKGLKLESFDVPTRSSIWEREPTR